MYHSLIFRPLYNGLVGLMDLIPWIDLGIAVIIFTIIVKLILSPLAKSSILTQIRMKEVEPEVNKIKSQYSGDRQAQGMKVMALYREKKIKPFSGVLLLLIQLPILLALIQVFYKIIPTINPEFLYSFVSSPEIKIYFLGFIDLTTKSIILSIATAVIQFVQMHFSPALRQHKASANNPQNDFASRLSATTGTQMKYFLPIFAFISTYWIIPAQFPAAASIIAIYWSTSSLFTLVQEIIVRKRYSNATKVVNSSS